MFQVSSQFPLPNFGEDVETSYILNLVMELSNLEMGLVVHLMIQEQEEGHVLKSNLQQFVWVRTDSN